MTIFDSKAMAMIRGEWKQTLQSQQDQVNAN